MSPTPLPTPDPRDHDLATIASHGYTPDPGSEAETDDGNGGTLLAWRGTCSSSGDGHCQRVFFFIDRHYLGTDTFTASPGIRSVESVGSRRIAVTYNNYLANDPLCCPSGQPVTITYTWDSGKLTPDGVPPGHTP